MSASFCITHMNIGVLAILACDVKTYHTKQLPVHVICMCVLWGYAIYMRHVHTHKCMRNLHIHVEVQHTRVFVCKRACMCFDCTVDGALIQACWTLCAIYNTWSSVSQTALFHIYVYAFIWHALHCKYSCIHSCMWHICLKVDFCMQRDQSKSNHFPALQHLVGPVVTYKPVSVHIHIFVQMCIMCYWTYSWKWMPCFMHTWRLMHARDAS